MNATIVRCVQTISGAKWAAIARGMLQNDEHVARLNQRTQSLVYKTKLTAVRPGAFVRQALSMMFTASGEWGLANKYRELATSVRDGETTSFPDDMWLGMALCAGPFALMSGPGLSVDLADRSWRWLCVVAYPPLAFELTLAASEMQFRSGLVGIGDFVQVPELDTHDVELDLMVAFTHTALPGDWRNETQIRDGLDLDGSRLSE